MKILRIAANGVHGQTFAHDLADFSVFVGPNGAGKTTRIKALLLGLRGPGAVDFNKDCTVHVRLEVPPNVHPGARLDVFRNLGAPQHTLALAPLASSSVSVAKVQAQLDGIVRIVPASWDVSAFAGLTADEQKEALLPLATAPAAGYAGLWPELPPVAGEAAIPYLMRLRADLAQQLQCAQGREAAAAAACQEIADRPVALVRPDLGALQANLAAARRSVAILEEVAAAIEAEAQASAAATMAGIAGSVAESRNVAEDLKRAQDEAAEWAQRGDASVQRASELAQLQQAERWAAKACADLPGAPMQDDRVQALGTLARLEPLAQQLADLQRVDAQIQAELAAAISGSLLPRALVAALEAAAITGRGSAVPALAAELRHVLHADGCPSVPAIYARLGEVYRAKVAIELPFHYSHDIADARTVVENTAGVELFATVRAKAEQALTQAQQALADAYARHAAERLSLGEYDPSAHAQSLELVKRLSVERTEALIGIGQSGAAESTALAIAQARRKAALKAWFDALGGVDVERLPERLTEARKLLGKLVDDWDWAQRAIGRQQADDQHRHDYELARAQSAELPPVQAAVHAALDDCLRQSLGSVTDALAPFAALLGGTWRLSACDPLGIVRGDTWIGWDALSASEQIVLGVGIVVALSTAKQGLRLVILDRLDACDLPRRRALVGVIRQLLAAGKIDQVIGTAWSADGFEGATLTHLGAQ